MHAYSSGRSWTVVAENFRIFRTDMILVQLCAGSKGALFRIPTTWAWFTCIAIAGVKRYRGVGHCIFSSLSEIFSQLVE